MPRAEDLDDASTPRKTAPLSMDWLLKLEGAGLKGGEKQEHTWGVKNHTSPPPQTQAGHRLGVRDHGMMVKKEGPGPSPPPNIGKRQTKKHS